ncbi:protein Dss4p [Monosporozyma unispora]|nr:hypothetical protein C6P44_000921 [Kazachstania unispora]
MSYCCSFKDCSCKIIKLDCAPVVKLQNSALDVFKLMQQHKNDATSTNVGVEFLLVKDVWDFDNIGVSKDIPSYQDVIEDIEFEHDGEQWKLEQHLKYLICADCDKGPIGIVCSVSNGDKKNTVYMLSLPSVSQI